VDGIWSEWLHLLTRWAHIIFGIAWIGSSFFFVWLENNLEPPATNDPNAHKKFGSIWMVHGGGFYQMEKKKLGPGEIPSTLHWFKWEATAALISGLFLLGLIYYSGQGVFLLDENVANITFHMGVLISISVIVISWLIYDFIWASSLGEKGFLPHALTILLLIGIAYGLSQVFSGRAAYIHVGTCIGTWMVLSVWKRIVPAQNYMIHCAQTGEEWNPQLSKKAKQRSFHNNYFTLPLIFIMISNHFPITYGHHLNWVLLLVISLGSVFVRHFFNIRHKKDRTMAWIWMPALLCLMVAMMITTSEYQSEILDKEHHQSLIQANLENPAKMIDQGSVISTPPTLNEFGSITGVVTYSQKVIPKTLTLPSSCAKMHQGPVLDNSLLVKDQKLQNAFVQIAHDFQREFPIPPQEVVLDQKGCIYNPRVIGVMIGQTVTFVNSDPVFHNVKANTELNTTFNLAMPKQNQRISKVFKSEEMTVHAKCSVHPWMSAHIGVVNHPYFAVTDQQGSFEITQVPVGEYSFKIWHEVLGEKIMPVKVGPNQVVQLTIDY
jgi:uncharacterized membrane protein/plastocyanin